MAEEFKILLGVDFKSGELDKIKNEIKSLQSNGIEVTINDTTFNTQLQSIRSRINNIQANQINIRLNDRNVLRQLDNIRRQIQSLGNIRINLGGGNANSGINNTVTALQRATRDVANLYKQIRDMELKLGKLEMSGADSGNIAQYTAQLDQLRFTYQRLVYALGDQNVDLNFVFNNINQSRTEMAQLSSEIDNVRTKLASDIKININNGSLQDQIEVIENKFNSLNVANTNVANGISNLRRLLGTMDASDDIESVTNDYREFQQVLKTVTNQVNDLQRQQKNDIADMNLGYQRNALASRIDVWLKNNSAATKQFGSQLNDLKIRLQSCDKVELNGIKAEFAEIIRQAQLAGKATMSFGDRFKASFTRLSTYFSAYEIFSIVSNSLRSMYDSVVEIDTAMTDLYKVTDETAIRYEQFLESASKNAQELGRSMSSFIQQSANWAKMGYDTVESAELAKISSIYANVADVDDTTAVSDIVTAMKAFNIEAENAISIIDPMNKISNEFAVTAAGLGQGLSRAASTMATSKTSLEQTLALLTGISEITQSPEEAGNFLKTAVARIQGMKGELEELGEEVDESVDSISKVQTQILNLTSGTSKAVNIFDESGNFRNYYEIMQDIASIVDELESTERAQLYEILFGKTRMNQGAAMIQAFQSGQIGEALEAALDAEGSAYAEQEKWMESLKAKLGELEAAWEGLSETFLKSDLLKKGIDFLIDFVNFLEKVIDKVGALNTIVAGIGIGKGVKGLLTLGGDIKSFKDIFTALGAVFPNVSRGISVFTGALANGTRGVGLAKAAISGLWTVISAHPIIATIGAITLAIKAFDLFTTSAEEAREKMETAFSEYEDAKQKVEDVNKELQTTKERMDELQAKGGLTFVEKQELEDLREATELLQIQADLAEKEAAREGKEAAESTVTAYNKNFKYDISKDAVDEYEYYADLNFNNAGLLADESNISAMLAGIRQFKELRDSVELGSEDWEHYKGIIDGATDSVWEQVDSLVGYKEKLESIPESYRTEEQKNALSAINNAINLVYQELDPAKWEQIKLNEIFDDKHLSNAKQELIDIATANKTIGVTVEDVEKKYPELAKAVKKAGFTIQNLVDNINSEAGVVNLDEVIKNIKKQFASSDYILDLTSGEDAQNKIIDFNNWINNLTPEEKELVYEISCDIDTSNFALQDWKEYLNSFTVPEDQRISISDLMADEGFTSEINAYIEPVEKLQEALGKIRDGDFSASDIIELFDEFPQLSDNAGDLEGAIADLLGSMNSDIVTYFYKQFGKLETDEDRAALQAFMNTVLELGEVVGNTQFGIDISTETEGIDALKTAMKESVSSTGLTSESVKALKARYQDLENYNPARLFEETTNGIHLNTDALNELEKEYEKQVKSKLDDKLDDLKEKYNKLTNEINECIDANDNLGAKELYAKRDNIVDQINDVATLASQYEGLTSAYRKWEDSQSNGDERDMYSGIIAGKEELEEEMSRGWLDEGSVAYLELLSGKDLSTATLQEMLDLYKGFNKEIAKSGHNVWDFFTYDEDGKETSEGIYNFFDTLIAKQEELKRAGKWEYGDTEWVSKDKDGNYAFDFSVAGGDKAVADALGVSEELVQIVLRAAKDAQFVVNLESSNSELADFKDMAESVNDRLKEIGATKYTFNINSTDVENVEEQIKEAETALDNLKNEDGTLKVGVNEEDYKNAQILLASLIFQKQTLDESIILRVDTNNAEEGSIESVIKDLQDFKANYNTLEVKTVIGADTTEAEANLNTSIETLKENNKDSEVLMKLGIDPSGTPEKINDAIAAIEEQQLIELGITFGNGSTTDGEVVWKNNINAVTAWAGEEGKADRTAEGTVDWSNASVPTFFNTPQQVIIDKYEEIESGADKSALTPDDITAIVNAYKELETGVDISKLTPDDIVAYVSEYLEKEGVVSDNLTPENIIAIVSAYQEIEGGADTSQIGLDSLSAIICKYAESENIDLSQLSTQDIEAIVSSYAEAIGCDKDKLLQNFTAYITTYDDSKATLPSGKDVELNVNVSEDAQNNIDNFTNDIDNIPSEKTVIFTVNGAEVEISADKASDVLSNAGYTNDQISEFMRQVSAGAILKIKVDSSELDSLFGDNSSSGNNASTFGEQYESTISWLDELLDRVNKFGKNSNNVEVADSYVENIRVAADNLAGIDGEGLTNTAQLIVDALNLLSSGELNEEDASALANVVTGITTSLSALSEDGTLTKGIGDSLAIGIANGLTSYGFETTAETVASDINTALSTALSNGQYPVDVCPELEPDSVHTVEQYTFTDKELDIISNASSALQEIKDIDKYNISDKTYTVTEIRKSSSDGNYPLVNGTAHIHGTAFARGNWGTKNSGTALMGELGTEILVRNGRYYTVGDNGAEFVKYQKGDIIFNHKQSEELFKYGRVTSNGGRGKAFLEGTAFDGGSRDLLDEYGSYGKAPSKITISGAVKKTKTKTKKKKSSSEKSTKSSADEFEETFDWIEIAIDRIERAISRLDTKANSIYRSWSSRNNNLQKEISKVGDEIDLQQQAYDRYIKQADSVGLSETYATKVRDGTIDIETITNEALAEKVGLYREWYEKALDCEDAMLELKETQSELYQQAFDNIVTQYDGFLSVIEHERNMLEEYISQSEASGYIVSTKYYDALINVEKANIAKLEEEKEALLTSLEEAVNSGTIKPDSEAWHEMVSEIDQVTLSILEANTSLIEFNNSIRDIEWQIFDMLQEQISQVTDEANFLIDLFSNDKLYDDKGQLTDEGMATMGLHGQNYNTYMEQANKYAEEMLKINKKLADDPYNQDLIERRQELLELQQESILAAEDEKQAIVDMVKEGIELELDALSELINKYTDALDSQKDLYDYQKKVKEQVEEIAMLEKQLSAYAGDNSEETRSKIQEIKVSLEEARENLEETEYDRYIEDQKKLLDELYLEYETILNMRLDNIDSLLSDMITGINNNATTIKDALIGKSDSLGYTLSDTMKNIWTAKDDDGNDVNVLAIYSKGIQDSITSLSSALSGFSTNIENMTASLDSSANTNVQSATISSAVYSEQAQSETYDVSTAINASGSTASSGSTDTKINNSDTKKTDDTKKSNSTDSKSNSSNKTNKTNKNDNIFDYKKDSYPKSKLNTSTSVVDRLKYSNYDSSFSARSDYYSEMGFSGTYTGSAKQNTQMLSWMKKNGYKNGHYRLSKNELAWTQEGRGMEAIIRPSDGAILTPLVKDDSVLKASATSNMFNFFNDPSSFIRDNLNIGNSVSGIPSHSASGNTYDNDFSMQVVLPNVQNYEQFKYAMQHDKSFEKMVRAMTVDKMFGGSSLKKYNC